VPPATGEPSLSHLHNLSIFSSSAVTTQQVTVLGATEKPVRSLSHIGTDGTFHVQQGLSVFQNVLL
jgi:hypothetical protein